MITLTKSLVVGANVMRYYEIINGNVLGVTEERYSNSDNPKYIWEYGYTKVENVDRVKPCQVFNKTKANDAVEASSLDGIVKDFHACRQDHKYSFKEAVKYSQLTHKEWELKKEVESLSSNKASLEKEVKSLNEVIKQAKAFKEAIVEELRQVYQIEGFEYEDVLVLEKIEDGIVLKVYEDNQLYNGTYMCHVYE